MEDCASAGEAEKPTTLLPVRCARLGLAVAAAATFFVLEAAPGQSALFFLLKPTSARPGDRIVVRTGGTPMTFGLSDRAAPLQQPIMVYLVPNSIAADVRSRHDPRLIKVGQLIPDRNGHGILSFNVPGIQPGSYAAAAWCPGCAQYSAGRTFFTLAVTEATLPRFRPLMLLRLERSERGSVSWPLVMGLIAVAFGAVFGGALFALRRRASRRLGRRAIAARRQPLPPRH